MSWYHLLGLLMDILCIPDAHAHPEAGNERFDILGKFIIERRPSVILCIGDLFSMDSLSSFDKGKRSFEGRRYTKDIEVGIDAQRRMFAPTIEHNKLKSDKKKYKPRKVFTLGNHEHRIERATQEAPELEGAIGYKDLKLEEFGWEVYPFRDVVNIEGVNFSHYFSSGVMDRAISGNNIGKSLLNIKKATVVQGHSHLLSIATEVTVNNDRIWGISAGCYLDHYEPYTSKSIQETFWRGVLMLSDVHNGDFDLELISLDRLKKYYA